MISGRCIDIGSRCVIISSRCGANSLIIRIAGVLIQTFSGPTVPTEKRVSKLPRMQSLVIIYKILRILVLDATVIKCLEEASSNKHTMQEIRKIAASFLLRGRDVMSQQVNNGEVGIVNNLEVWVCLVTDKKSDIQVKEIKSDS